MANVIQFTIKGVDSFSNVGSKVGKSLTTMAKATAKVTAVAAAAGGGVLAFVNKITAGQDEVGKFANRLGFAVEELTAVQFAAERSSIAVTTMNMAAQRLSRRAAEAAQGTGEAKDAIAELGLNAQAFSKLGIEGKMSAVAKAMEGVKDAGDRTRLAFKLFDSEGVKMLQMLGNGEQAFKDLTAEADKFGAVMSAQAVANAEKFQDAMTNMSAATSGIFRGISNELAPFLTTAVNKMAEFFASIRGDVVAFTKAAVKGFFTVIAVAEKILNSIKDMIDKAFTAEGFQSLVDGFQNATKFIFESALKLFPAIGKLILNTFKVAFEGVKEIGRWAWENIKSIFSDAEGPDLSELLFSRLGEATAAARADLGGVWEDFKIQTKETADIVAGSMMEAFDITTEGIDSRVESLMESARTVGEVAKVIAEETTASVAASTEAAVEATKERVLTFQEEMTAMHEAFMEQRGTEVHAFAETLYNTVQTAIDSISNAMTATLLEGADLMEGVRAISKQVVAEIIKSLIKMGIQRLLTSVIVAGANKTEAATGAARSAGLAFSNTMATMSAAPFPINLTAPAVAAAHAATALAGFATNAAAGAAAGAAIAHGGLTNVPSESTYLLDKGERVLSPNQNQDLIEFMSSRGDSGSAVVIENLDVVVLPNATNADSLLAMDPKDMRDVVAEKIISALNDLDSSGIRPVYAERGV